MNTKTVLKAAYAIIQEGEKAAQKTKSKINGKATRILNQCVDKGNYAGYDAGNAAAAIAVQGMNKDNLWSQTWDRAYAKGFLSAYYPIIDKAYVDATTIREGAESAYNAVIDAAYDAACTFIEKAIAADKAGKEPNNGTY